MILRQTNFLKVCICCPIKYLRIRASSVSNNCSHNKMFPERLEAQQRSVKIKFKFLFNLMQLSEMHAAGRINPLVPGVYLKVTHT